MNAAGCHFFLFYAIILSAAQSSVLWIHWIVPTRSYLQKEKDHSTFCNHLLNGFLMSSLCPVFLIFLVFLLYHDANILQTRAKCITGQLADFWFDLTFLGERVRHCRTAWGRLKKDPTVPFAYFHSVISFSFFLRPEIFVARTSGRSALMLVLRVYFPSTHTVG